MKQHLYGFNISMFYWSNRVKTTISMFHPSLFMENCHFHGTNHEETISCSLKNQNVWWQNHATSTCSFRNHLVLPGWTAGAVGEVDGAGRRAGPFAALPPALPGSGGGNVSLWPGAELRSWWVQSGYLGPGALQLCLLVYKPMKPWQNPSI